jgi:hypothetical protein
MEQALETLGWSDALKEGWGHVMFGASRTVSRRPIWISITVPSFTRQTCCIPFGRFGEERKRKQKHRSDRRNLRNATNHFI